MKMRKGTTEVAQRITTQTSVTRREAIQTLGVIGLGAAVGACGSSAAEIEIPSSCILTPRQVEGPFFVDTGLMRRNITDGRPGVPLGVRLQVVDADNGCQPIENAVVEIWHADAEGAYSGFGIDDSNTADVQGESFLRGFQMTDRNGRAEFETIYPGWYPIRTIHIHAMVLIDGVEQVTTQLYFDQAANDRAMSMPPYDSRGAQRVRNEDDPLVDPATLAELSFDLEERAGGFEASHLLAISRS